MTETPPHVSSIGARLHALGTGAVPRILMGSIIGQGIIVAISPILTRLYSPEDFAALVLLTAMTSVLGSIVTLAWEGAIVIPRADETARAVVWLGLFSTTVITAVIAVLAFTLRAPLTSLFGLEFLTEFWWVLPVTVGLLGLQKVVSPWFLRIEKYGQLAQRNLIQGVGQAVFNLSAGFASLAPLGLIGGLAAGRLASLVPLLGRSSPFRGTVPSRRSLLTAAKRFRRFPLVSTWSYSLNSLGLQIPIFLLASLYGGIELGLVALTMRVLASPIGMITDAVSQVYEGRLAAHLRQGDKDLTRILTATTLRLLAVGIGPTILVIIFAPPVFGFVFGEQWIAAGVFAQILVVCYLLQLCVAPISASLTILERQVSQLFWDVSRLVLVTGSILGASLLSLSFTGAIAAYAAAQSVAYAVLFAISFRAVSRVSHDREAA